MASTPVSPLAGPGRDTRFFTRTENLLLAGLLALLAACAVLMWTTRDAMLYLHRNGGAQQLVNQQPWETAQTLATLAVSAEEHEFAREAGRLADHEVNQAFAAALRQAQLDAQHRKLTGEALELSQKIAQLEQVKQQDQAQVESLAKQDGPASNDAIDEAKAQLALDNDELADAQRDLERAAGDRSAEIQDELAAHEAASRKFEGAAQSDSQIAVLSAKSHHTLAARITAWFNQRSRLALIEQARQDALNAAQKLTAEHNALEAKTETASAAAAPDRASKLAQLKDRGSERQILSIDDDRIETEQQLAQVYAKWAGQVKLQHRIVMHLILGSLALILAILAAMVLCSALVRRLTSHPAIDRRQKHTLRSVLDLAIQAIGAVLVLIVIFGTPQETSTILGLATAALTIALQDYILAFLGWFALMGKNGIRVGDWVEINGVCGEVTGIGLISTTLLETGGLDGQGQPTGRRTSFMNGFAIRGQFFNFSTAGQWMWDEIAIGLPSSADAHAVMEQTQQFVSEETRENAQHAEQEWKHALREESLGKLSAAPIVSLRPAAAGVELQIRYVTSAAGRSELRDRLYARAAELLRAAGHAI